MTVWFRLKLSDMEKSHLEHFDVFNEKSFPIEKEYIRNLVIVNICFLYVALIFYYETKTIEWSKKRKLSLSSF